MRNLRRYVYLLGACSLMLVVFRVEASAKFIPRVGAQPAKDGTACVIVNNRQAIQLRTPNGKCTPVERANIVAGRLAALVQKGLDPKAIWYRDVGQSTRVMAGSAMLVIATKAEARARGLSTARLAAIWVQNLRKLLSLPPLSASTTSLTVPLGETRVLGVECLLPGKVVAQVSDPTVIQADPETRPGSLVVRGLSVGRTTITIRCDEYGVAAEVAVRKYAAALAEVRRAVVTGSETPASLVKRAAGDAARAALALEPGASVTHVSIPGTTKPLSAGQSARIPVAIEASGANYITARLTTHVDVANQRLKCVPAAWIMYSNSPERILRYQVLYTGRIAPGEEAVRLLYHHQNVMRERIGFVIDLANLSAVPACLHMVEGCSEPMADPILIGYSVGARFMKNHYACIGRVLEIPAGSRKVILTQPLDPLQTASGIMEFHQLSGEPVFVRVIARPEPDRLENDSPDAVLPAALDSWRIVPSDHVYPGPSKDVEVAYTVGKPWAFINIGKDALKHASLTNQLYGNYGVTYDISAKVVNPLSEPVTVEVVLEATAGEVCGIFLIDGDFVQVKHLRPPAERVIRKFGVPGGGERSLSIRTIPLSGSSYPAMLIIRAARR